MVDHVLYTNTVGAKESLRATRLLTNNLANMNTVGFHADYETLTTSEVKSAGLQTRTMPKIGQVYTDQDSGPINFTGRSLDVAVDGRGYIAVQSKSGQEGYTRAGNFDINSDGLLVTKKGELVLGSSGLITIPTATNVTIDEHGIISAQIKGESETTIAEVGRLKLASFGPNSLAKGADSLFYPKSDGAQDDGHVVKLIPESLEGSNVDPVRALVELIDLSRQFDSQAKIMKMAEENGNKANGLLSIQS